MFLLSNTIRVFPWSSLNRFFSYRYLHQFPHWILGSRWLWVPPGGSRVSSACYFLTLLLLLILGFLRAPVVTRRFTAVRKLAQNRIFSAVGTLRHLRLFICLQVQLIRYFNEKSSFSCWIIIRLFYWEQGTQRNAPVFNIRAWKKTRVT